MTGYDGLVTWTPQQIWGVDFSGALLAGKNIWIAQILPVGTSHWCLTSLNSLERITGQVHRDASMRSLVELIRSSHKSLWALDFPFGLPVELTELGRSWTSQLRFLANWGLGARDFGRWCVKQALRRGLGMHVRRETDKLSRTPFDCYHYRIIYQTFHGMRDVLLPLSRDSQTAILPFQTSRRGLVDRVVVEACPSSTLKRLNLPHQNYKQPTGGPLLARRRRTRRSILLGIDGMVKISAEDRRKIMRNPGGDALDAVLAAVGAAQAWSNFTRSGLQNHPRFRKEGLVYA